MRVLVVARFKNGRFVPFVSEQVEALEKTGIQCKFFGVRNKGFWGYIRQYPELLRSLREFKPDIVHAHYGLCGLLANFQRRVPVVTTYHGSDINDSEVLRLSRIAIRGSRFNIFVSQKNLDRANPQKNFGLIPCGVNLDDYPIVDKVEARKQMGLDMDRKYVLFAGAFGNPVKNAPLAQSAVSLLPGVQLLELKGYSRAQVALLMQAVDVLLMTSHTEGSPQVIKEAMVCGCPIVSVDVGDVKELVDEVEGCFVTERSPHSIVDGLNSALAFSGRTRGREVIIKKKLTNDFIAKQILAIYRRITK